VIYQQRLTKSLPSIAALKYRNTGMTAHSVAKVTNS